jgi:uncharacterized protein YcfL
MKNSLLLTITLFLTSYLLTACNEQANPLVGQWQQISPSTGLPEQTVEFTPSTMLINDTRVTVVYQIRENKVRVSASKNEIIYEFIDDDSIQYEDKQHGITKLVRIKP